MHLSGSKTGRNAANRTVTSFSLFTDLKVLNWGSVDFNWISGQGRKNKKGPASERMSARSAWVELGEQLRSTSDQSLVIVEVLRSAECSAEKT